MKTLVQILSDMLDRELTLSEIKDASTVALKKLHSLLHHWTALVELEIERRAQQ